jgi:hypothetical protein
MMSKGFYQDDVKWAELPGQFRAVKLPYKGSKMVAVAVLPDRVSCCVIQTCLVECV